MNQTLCILIVVASCLSAGCANEPVAPGNAVAAVAQQQQQAEGAQGDSSIGDKLGSLMEKAKSNAPSMDDVKGMFNKAGDATEQTADDAMAWANDMYKSLSERGMTTSSNVTDWISEDWNNINAWEYQVINVGADTESQQEKLNESGKQRWECFHVSETSTGITFYMKRQKKSYMKSLPLKDMLKLVPLLDSE